MTPISFVNSLEDMVAASRFGYLRVVKTRYIRYILVILAMSAIIVGAVAFFENTGFSVFLKYFFYLSGAYLALGLLTLTLVYWLFIPYKTRKSIEQAPALSREISISWDSETLNFISSDGQSNLKIAELHKWAANAQNLVIYPMDNLHYIIPSRIFPGNDSYQDLIQNLQKAGIKRI